MKKFYLTIIGIAMASFAATAQNPEEIYLVGSLNNWTVPADDSAPLTMTNEGNGIYTYSIADVSAIGGYLEFKLFTAKTDWSDQENYWGAPYSGNSQPIFAGTNATWTIVQGWDGANISVSNVSDLKGSLKLTLDWNKKELTATADNAPEMPASFRFVLEGDDISSDKYILSYDGNGGYTYSGTFNIPAGKFTGYIYNSQDEAIGNYRQIPTYLWSDFTMSVSTGFVNFGASSPFSCDNWKGGDIRMEYNIANNTITYVAANDQPAMPQRIYLVTNPAADGSWSPSDCPWYLDLNKETTTYRGTINIPADAFNFKIGVEGLSNLLGFKGDAPVEIFNNERASLFLFDSPEASAITCSNWVGGEITMEMFRDFVYLGIEEAPDQPTKVRNLYLIGAPQNWDITSDAMTLTSTDMGNTYTGSFDIAPGDAMFRFYQELGDWDSYSYGAQWEDSNVICEFTDGIYSGAFVWGKGNWSFPDWPGGKMNMTVDFYHMQVLFADEEHSKVDTVSENLRIVKTFKGGVKVEAADSAIDIFDLQGRRVARLGAGESVTLPAGIYMAAGEKLLVK